jgi:hypothetical protein
LFSENYGYKGKHPYGGELQKPNPPTLYITSTVPLAKVTTTSAADFMSSFSLSLKTAKPYAEENSKKDDG